MQCWCTHVLSVIMRVQRRWCYVPITSPRLISSTTMAVRQRLILRLLIKMVSLLTTQRLTSRFIIMPSSIQLCLSTLVLMERPSSLLVRAIWLSGHQRMDILALLKLPLERISQSPSNWIITSKICQRRLISTSFHLLLILHYLPLPRHSGMRIRVVWPMRILSVMLTLLPSQQQNQWKIIVTLQPHLIL